MERLRTTYEVDARGVARLTLNRPEKLNALDAPMRDEIAATLDEVNADPDVKILVIGARGSYFGAGLDVKDFGQMTPQGSKGQSA
ncbi:MAG: enoyl-CoA hydratase/isomerase family protein [Rubrivivax sp.]